MNWPLSVLSDLLAGVAASAIVSGLVFVARRVGPEVGRRWATKLRRLGWPLLTSVFFATTLASARFGGPTKGSLVFLSILLGLAVTLVILRRFGPAKIRDLLTTAQAHSWPILCAVFFLITVVLLRGGSIIPRERIVFAVDLADEEMVVFRDILDAIEPKLGADVFLVHVDSSRHVARLDKMVASGETRWDLVAVDNNILGLLVAKGLVQELSEYVKPEELLPATLLPSLRPILTFNDKLYFAPFRPNIKITFYNKCKFAEHGLKPPNNWKQLLEVARVFKEKERVGRVAIQGYPGKTSAITVFEFVKATGGDPFTLDDDGSRDAFDFLQQLEPYLAREHVDTSFDTANELLIDNEVYLVSNWTYGIKVVIEDAGKEEIGVYSGWEGPQREFHTLRGDVLAIPKGARKPDAARKLIELLLSREIQKELASRLHWLPARLDALDANSPYLQAITNAVSVAEPRSTEPQWLMVEDVLNQAFRGVIQKSDDSMSLEHYSALLREIPSDFLLYRVESGDTLKAIASHHDTETDILAVLNGIPRYTSVRPGEILLIPQQQVPASLE